MIVVTTEKDAPRLKNLQGFNEVVRGNLFVFPIEIEILKENQNQNIFYGMIGKVWNFG